MRALSTAMVAVVLWLICAAAPAATDDQPPVVVFAAASLTDVLQEIGVEYTKATHVPVKYSFAASSALARQIEAGALVDVFVSADQEWMDYLDQRNLIAADTRRDILANRLALAAPADSTLQLKIAPGFALRAALGPNGRLATGDPDSVPVGRYAKAALTSLGVWQDIEPRLVRAENVRAALAFVARGEVPLGIVYETDVKADPKVKLIGLFPPDSHPPITYPVAATRTASPRAAGFITFLYSPAAQVIFRRAGFQTLDAAR